MTDMTLINGLSKLLDAAGLEYRQDAERPGEIELGLEVGETVYRLQAVEQDRALVLAIPDLIGEPTPEADQAAVFGLLLKFNAAASSAHLALASDELIFALAVLPMPTGFSDEVFYYGLGDLMDLVRRVESGGEIEE